jgi:hypothetical protein
MVAPVQNILDTNLRIWLLPQLALYEYTWCYHGVYAKNFLVQLNLDKMSQMNTVYLNYFYIQFNCCDMILGWVTLEAAGSREIEVQGTSFHEGSKEPPHQVRTGMYLECINPFWSYVRPHQTLWFSCSWCFSSCSTDSSQQIVQVVLFLLMFFSFKTMIITSNTPTSFLPKINKSWGVCGWQKNWIGKGSAFKASWKTVILIYQVMCGCTVRYGTMNAPTVNERGGILSVNVAHACSWLVRPSRFDQSITHLCWHL